MAEESRPRGVPSQIKLRGVVLMARAPRPGTVRRALEPLLGVERCAALQATLIRLAVAWGERVATRNLLVACEPPDAEAELRALLGPRTNILPQNALGTSGRIADATGRLFEAGDVRAALADPLTEPKIRALLESC